MNKEAQIRLKGNPTILLADDEELMREVISIMIEENGGRVISAIDGKEAVDVFYSHRDAVDCVLLDFSMPEMNGYQAFKHIRSMKPSVPVIIISGLQITPEIDELRKKQELIYISKPFHEDEIIDHIANLLNTESGQGSCQHE